MANLALCLVVQLYLVFGIAGMVWPERFMPLFGILMFPWAASYRVIRMNGVAAIATYLFLLGKVVVLGL